MNQSDIYKSEVDAAKALAEASKAKIIIDDDSPISVEDQLSILQTAKDEAAEKSSEYQTRVDKAAIDQ